MRRWSVVVFLLFVLPLQMAWAVAAPVCAHEAEAGAKKHLGHHEHRHQGAKSSAAAGDHDGQERTEAPGTFHADCESCHLGTSVTPVCTPASLVVQQPRAFPAGPGDAYRSHVPSGPERPDRFELPAAARFGGGVEFRPLTG